MEEQYYDSLSNAIFDENLSKIKKMVKNPLLKQKNECDIITNTTEEISEKKLEILQLLLDNNVYVSKYKTDILCELVENHYSNEELYNKMFLLLLNYKKINISDILELAIENNCFDVIKIILRHNRIDEIDAYIFDGSTRIEVDIKIIKLAMKHKLLNTFNYDDEENYIEDDSEVSSYIINNDIDYILSI